MPDTNTDTGSGSPERVALDLFYHLARHYYTNEIPTNIDEALTLYGKCLAATRGLTRATDY